MTALFQSSCIRIHYTGVWNCLWFDDLCVIRFEIVLPVWWVSNHILLCVCFFFFTYIWLCIIFPPIHAFRFFFFPFIFIHWRLITLQYCSGFCHILTWLSHGFTYIPYPYPPFRLPLHSIPLGLPSAPALSTRFMHYCVFLKLRYNLCVT